jgi:hypothetical protein
MKEPTLLRQIATPAPAQCHVLDECCIVNLLLLLLPVMCSPESQLDVVAGLRAAEWPGGEAEWDTRVAAAAWVSSYLVNICAEYKPRLVSKPEVPRDRVAGVGQLLPAQWLQCWCRHNGGWHNHVLSCILLGGVASALSVATCLPPVTAAAQAFGGPALLMHSAPSSRSTRDVVVGWAAGYLAPIAFLLQPMRVVHWYSPATWASSMSAGAYLSSDMALTLPSAHPAALPHAAVPAAASAGAVVPVADSILQTGPGANTGGSLASQLASQLEAELLAAYQSRVEVQPILDSLAAAAATAGAHASTAPPLALLEARARALGVEDVVLGTRGQSGSDASFVMVGSPVRTHSFDVMSGGGRSSHSSQPAGWAAAVGTSSTALQTPLQPQAYVGLGRVGLGRIGEEEGSSGQLALGEHTRNPRGLVPRRTSPVQSSAALAATLVGWGWSC